MNRFDALETVTAYQFNIYAMEHQTVLMGMMKTLVYARLVSHNPKKEKPTKKISHNSMALTTLPYFVLFFCFLVYFFFYIFLLHMLLYK